MAHIYTELFLLISILASQHGLGSAIGIEIDQKKTGKMENEVTISCLEDESPHTVLKPILIEVGRVGERPLATIDQRSHVSLMDGMKNNYKAEGYFGQGKMSNFLRLKIMNPSLNDTGEYNCIIFYVDIEGEMEKHIASANLTVEKLDMMRIIDFLMDKVSLLENKVDGQTKTISQQEKKLDDQERRLQNQLDDQQKQAIKNSNEVSECMEFTKNQSQLVNDRVSRVKARVGELETFTPNQSLILADLHDKDTALSAFSVGYSSNDKFKDGDVMIFRKVLVNIGNDYNNANGQYTAPRDGLYVFHLTIMPSWSVQLGYSEKSGTNGNYSLYPRSRCIQGGTFDSILDVDIIANGNLVARIHAMEKTHYEQSSGSALVQLEKGHVVKAVVKDITDTYNEGWGFPYSMFTGYLFKPL